MNRKELAILLSKLKGFESPKVEFEQYFTDSDTASDFLWNIRMKDGFEGKAVADFGCGPGIFGIGALVLGAGKAIFVDIDAGAIAMAKKNLRLVEDKLGVKLNAEFLNIPISKFSLKADMVLQNPPFGVQFAHADRAFLIKAMETSNLVYSFHKIESRSFVEQLSMDHGFDAQLYLKYRLPLKKTMGFHTKSVHNVEVGCFRIATQNRKV